MDRAKHDAKPQQPLRSGAAIAERPRPHDEAAEPTLHMVGDSAPMRAVYQVIRKYAATDAPVLITGESGTGKELAAKAIHERSSYRAGPFVPINCAGLPPTLIASELFGHEKGAFTGAHQRRIGRIETARGGTVFLDEIGDLPLELQAHLLRFLQEKMIDRLGGCRPIEVDVRVIAATNTDLKEAVGAGRFRRDLFYRLNVLSLEMPPLRARPTDVELLCRYFLRRIADELSRPVRGFEPEATSALRAYHWPGNVRELISCIRRAVVMAEGERIGTEDLGLEAVLPGNGERATPVGSAEPAAALPAGETIAPLGRAKSEFEGAYVRAALRRLDGNVTRTAEELRVSRVTLYRLMRRHGIDPGGP